MIFGHDFSTWNNSHDFSHVLSMWKKSCDFAQNLFHVKTGCICMVKSCDFVHVFSTWQNSHQLLCKFHQFSMWFPRQKIMFFTSFPPIMPTGPVRKDIITIYTWYFALIYLSANLRVCFELSLFCILLIIRACWKYASSSSLPAPRGCKPSLSEYTQFFGLPNDRKIL